MNCPHCRTAFHEAWTPAHLQGVPEGQYVAQSLICPECRKIVIGFEHRSVDNTTILESHLLWPKHLTRPVPREVDDQFAADFTEAAAVLSISPKASAALSRRCLQDILREKAAVKPANLDREIQQVIDSKSTPSWLSDNLDAVRVVGNFAAHPIKSTQSGAVVDVEPGYLITPMAQGIRLTTGAEFAARDATPSPVQFDRLMPRARKVLEACATGLRLARRQPMMVASPRGSAITITWGLGHPEGQKLIRDARGTGRRVIGFDLGYWHRKDHFRVTFDHDHPAFFCDQCAQSLCQCKSFVLPPDHVRQCDLRHLFGMTCLRHKHGHRLGLSTYVNWV